MVTILSFPQSAGTRAAVETAPYGRKGNIAMPHSKGLFIARTRQRLLASVFGLALLPAGLAQAQTEWTGGGGTDDWFAAGNWSSGTPAASVQTHIENGGTVTVKGPNAIAGIINVGNSASGQLTISNGGQLRSNGANVGRGVGSSGAITVTGAGSTWTLVGAAGDGMIRLGQQYGASGHSNLTVSDGGLVTALGLSVGRIQIYQGATVEVTSGGRMELFDLNIAGGGAMTVSSGGGVSTISLLTIAEGTTVTLTGAGSTLSTGSRYRMLNGTTIVADGAILTATTTAAEPTTGQLYPSIQMANHESYNSVLVIGAREGEAAAAPGTVRSANGISFEAGTGTLVFNHTGADYTFADKLITLDRTPSGQPAGGPDNSFVRHVAGTTTLSADSSAFRGTTIGPAGGTELVNYRIRENYMIVDRLFAAAELRLGDGDSQRVVRIVRTDGRRP